MESGWIHYLDIVEQIEEEQEKEKLKEKKKVVDKLKDVWYTIGVIRKGR